MLPLGEWAAASSADDGPGSVVLKVAVSSARMYHQDRRSAHSCTLIPERRNAMNPSKMNPSSNASGGRSGYYVVRLAVVMAVGLAAVASSLWSAAPASAADRNRLEIVNHASGRRADVMWGSTALGQGVFLWRDNSSTSQEFDLLDSGNGFFRIRARHSAQCLMLDWRGGSYGNGTRIVQHPYCAAGYAPGEWRVRWLSGTRCSGGLCQTGIDHMLLVNRQTGRCLDAANPAGGRPPEQAVLQQWDCVTSTDAWNIGNQSWDLLTPGGLRAV
ncbi:MAG: RICIN domain-containing protein [Acidimicrobiales bacterium]